MGWRKRIFRSGLLIFFIAICLSDALYLSAQETGPRFRWRSPAPIHFGESGEVVLELIDWDPQRRAPTDIFQGMAPLNAILNEGNPSLSTEGIYLYTITLIPLEERNIVLAPFSHQYGSLRLNIPRISISVLPALQQSSETEGITNETQLSGSNMALQGEMPLFPEIR